MSLTCTSPSSYVVQSFSDAACTNRSGFGVPKSLSTHCNQNSNPGPIVAYETRVCVVGSFVPPVTGLVVSSFEGVESCKGRPSSTVGYSPAVMDACVSRGAFSVRVACNTTRYSADYFAGNDCSPNMIVSDMSTSGPVGCTPSKWNNTTGSLAACFQR